LTFSTADVADVYAGEIFSYLHHLRIKLLSREKMHQSEGEQFDQGEP
jgi:hypothetical protein